MNVIYQVTMNGSPVANVPECTLQAAAYTAACLAINAPSDRRGDRKARVYGVKPVDVRELTAYERETDRIAQGLAGTSRDPRLMTVAVSLIMAHESEALELAGMAKTVDHPVSVA